MCECIHLALMTLLLAFPVILCFQSDDWNTQLFYALGTVIPVQLIRFFCDRFQQKRLRILLSLAVIVLSVVLTWEKERWSVYLLCCLPILISGVFLPRSRGKILLTIPSVYSAAALVIAFAFGKSVETFGVPMIADLTLILTILMTLNFFAYTSQNRLLRDIHISFDTDADVSVAGMIRQCRRTTAAFLMIGILFVAAVPFLLKFESPKPLPMEEPTVSGRMEGEEDEVSVTESFEKEYSNSDGGEPIDLETYRDVFLAIIIAIPVITLFASVIKAVMDAVGNIKRKKKDPPAREIEGTTIERLKDRRSKPEREKPMGWEKRIRRRYEKMILQRTKPGVPLNALTPAELEALAEISRCQETASLHEIYEQTRYGTAPPTRELYRRFRELEKQLP